MSAKQKQQMTTFRFFVSFRFVSVLFVCFFFFFFFELAPFQYVPVILRIEPIILHIFRKFSTSNCGEPLENQTNYFFLKCERKTFFMSVFASTNARTLFFLEVSLLPNIGGKKKARPLGLEPPTSPSKNRCCQLDHANFQNDSAGNWTRDVSFCPIFQTHEILLLVKYQRQSKRGTSVAGDRAAGVVLFPTLFSIRCTEISQKFPLFSLTLRNA